MFEKYLNITDASKASPEHIDMAYNSLKDYCKENNLDLVEFIKNTDNIKPAAEHIHKELPFAARMILKKDKIEKLIYENLDFIQAKAQELHELEFGKPKKTKSKTKK
jgi:hypothetical protein